MTNEEAIEAFLPTVHNEAFIDGFQDACRLAVQALEKQIPMKVKEKQVVEDEAFCNLDFLCPACKNAVIGQPYEPNYCKHCGQALKWEE